MPSRKRIQTNRGPVKRTGRARIRTWEGERQGVYSPSRVSRKFLSLYDLRNTPIPTGVETGVTTHRTTPTWPPSSTLGRRCRDRSARESWRWCGQPTGPSSTMASQAPSRPTRPSEYRIGAALGQNDPCAWPRARQTPGIEEAESVSWTVVRSGKSHLGNVGPICSTKVTYHQEW